jgi:hypoxanthine phosphoribosyltransferase
MNEGRSVEDLSIDQAICIFKRAEIDLAIEAVAKKINQSLAGEDVLVLPILNGGLVFSGVLIPQLTMPLQLDYMHVSRYRNNIGAEQLQWRATPSVPLKGKSVLLVDDIFDRGDTLHEAIRWCENAGAKKVISAVLATKNLRDSTVRTTPSKPTFSALEVPDVYVFGFGMDYSGYFRNANGIFAFDAQ